ncbi:MAG: helix-turn-helix domain-containing protein [Pseudomonadota bacterium]
MPAAHRIAIVNYRGALTSAVHGMAEILRFAAELRPERQLAVEIVGHPDPGHDIYILPPAPQPIDTAAQPELPAALHRAHQRGAVMCSVCAGLIWLAEADILGARRVTTHWRLVSGFAERYPGTPTDADRILIEYRDLITAGGMMAWIDLSLALVERLLDRAAMIEVSSQFVIDTPRRDQRQYQRFVPDLGHDDQAVRRAQLYIESNFAHPLTLDTLAGVAGLSKRTFMRRFAKILGHTPLSYVQAVRIDKAKDILAQASGSIQNVAYDVGYGDHSAFSRRFHEQTGMTPQDFRRKYRAAAA